MTEPPRTENDAVPPEKPGDQEATGIYEGPSVQFPSVAQSGPSTSGVSQLPKVQLRDPKQAPNVEPHGGTTVPLETTQCTLAGNIRLDAEIARGGMGAILRGRDIELGRDVAVKVLLEKHAGKNEYLQRFVEEAQIAGQLQHPGVAPIYELGRLADQRPYFTMKLVKGKTLAALLAERKAVRWAESTAESGAAPVGLEDSAHPTRCDDLPRFIGIFTQVCQTLAYAHARGVIHRDLKPTNVMVGAFGEVQVMDWGLAKVLQEGDADANLTQPSADVSVIRTHRSADSDSSELGSYTQAGSVLGTPAYMAPEQARGEVDLIDERADVFGLGAILCEILTGQPPFVGKSGEATHRARLGDMDDAYARLDSCGADLDLMRLAKNCLAPKPWDRPRSAGQVADAMTAYQNSVVERLRQAELAHAAEQVRAQEEAKQRLLADQLAAAAQAQTVAERRRRRLAMALAAAVLAVVVVGGGGAFWFLQERRERQAQLDLALQQAELLRHQALAAGTDQAVAKWREARLAVEKASGVVGPSAPAVMQARLAELKVAVDRGLTEAEADVNLLARLDHIRSTTEGKQADAAYADAFRAAGLNLNAPEEMKKRLDVRPVKMQHAVIEALDAWSVVRGEEAGDAGLKRVLRAARALDPDDAWRNQLRDALERKDLDAFRKLAEQANALENQGPVGLWLLGHSLEKLGDHTLALVVLRHGQKTYAGDYWLNLELGTALFGGKRRGTGTDASQWILLGKPDPKVQEAEPYMMAAVALRPKFAPAYVALAAVYAKQGKLEEAVAVCRMSVQHDPNYSMGHNDLGLYLANLGKVEEGLAEIHVALRLDPKNEDAWTNVGHFLFRQGKLDEAAELFRQAAVLFPENAGHHTRLGNAFHRKGDLDQAIAEYRKALQLDPKDAWARNRLGDALRKQGKLDDSLQLQREFVALEPRNAEAHHLLGDALRAQKKLDDAIASYREAIKLDPNHYWANINLGQSLADKGDREEGIARLLDGIRLNPDEAWGHFHLGNTLRAHGKLKDAIAQLREAVRVEPKAAWLHTHLAGALRDDGQLMEADNAVREALRLNPKLYGAYLELGWLRRSQGRLKEAVEAFREAGRLNQQEALPHMEAGRILLSLGKDDEAIAAFKEGIQVDPTNGGNLFTLFAAMRRQGKSNVVIAECRRLEEADAKNSVIHHFLADYLRQQGDLTAALAEAQKDLTMSPESPFAHWMMGLVLLEQDKLEDALASLRRAASLAKGNFQTNLTRSALRRAERMAAVADKLPAYFDGDFKPQTVEERLGLAGLCKIKKHYAAAAGVYADLFEADPKLAANLVAGHRLDAARCAAMASGATGEKEPARWRKQARDWLQADMDLRRKQIEAAKLEVRTQIRQALQDWRVDPELAILRDQEALAKLTPEEQSAWRKLWAQVDALILEAREKEE